MSKKIGMIVGSLRKDSYNKLVAETVAKMLPEGFEAEFVEIGDLPFYNEDLETENPPKSWVRLRNQVKALDGVFFFTPEYNRSLPAAIANVVDVASRPYGQNVLDNKPAVVFSASQGGIGGFGANHHLRQSLVFVNMPVLAQPEAYLGSIMDDVGEDGEIIPETRAYLQSIVDAYFDMFTRVTMAV